MERACRVAVLQDMMHFGVAHGVVQGLIHVVW